MRQDIPEIQRLLAYRNRESNWKHWGPYLSERAWGTIREDYSPDGKAWEYFPHDHARSRAYRWNEDGLAGICDRNQYLCFALTLWNGRDPILKERLFGLTGPEGNHGEDVKEYYFYLDSTPTHSYMKMLYKYPQAEFPYANLVAENARRSRYDPEYELLDSGIFDSDRYFDVFVEYAKAEQNDILIQITAYNRGEDSAELYILPTLWFRNTWSWGYAQGPMGDVDGRPELFALASNGNTIQTHHPVAGKYHLYSHNPQELIFTENETNTEKLFGLPNASPYVKDAFHQYLVNGHTTAVNLDRRGTKVAAIYRKNIGGGENFRVQLRLSNVSHQKPFAEFDTILIKRMAEADQFYKTIQNPDLDEDQLRVQRQALAGMLCSKQLYYYDVAQWLESDPVSPAPKERKYGRNQGWKHLHNFDLISMPDKWEYPWYATWDLAFHALPLTLVDPDFAKRQLKLITREWYMHPNGQLPAYEWSFGDVNPPVHAWAAWRVYKIDARLSKEPDRLFLESIFHKLLLNFTWWTNRKDADGNNIFQGGFLGLDNISVFDRSAALPSGGHFDQSDGTAWMGAFCLIMMKIALELAQDNPVYQDTASKFFEHFLWIADAMSNRGQDGYDLWDEQDGFFYDALHLPDKPAIPLKVRSMVGLLPLFAVETLEPELIDNMPDFARRMRWFVENRPHQSTNLADMDLPGTGKRRLLSILTRERLAQVLHKMLDEEEFLSPYGIRSLSKFHEQHPYSLVIDGQEQLVPYWPGESHSGMFGGNSNWRGPVWFPINFLIIESLQKYHHYYGDDFIVEFPTRSGDFMNLWQVADQLSQRLMKLFLINEHGYRPIYGQISKFQEDPHWKDLILFYEYFHGDNGAGLGASHQTGWTGLIAKLLQQLEDNHRQIG